MGSASRGSSFARSADTPDRAEDNGMSPSDQQKGRFPRRCHAARARRDLRATRAEAWPSAPHSTPGPQRHPVDFPAEHADLKPSSALSLHSLTRRREGIRQRDAGIAFSLGFIRLG